MLKSEGADDDDGNYILVDCGASRAACPPQHAPQSALRIGPPLDIRTADDRTVEHFGEKDVSYELVDAQGVAAVDVQHQVAGVTHPVLGSRK